MESRIRYTFYGVTSLLNVGKRVKGGEIPLDYKSGESINKGIGSYATVRMNFARYLPGGMFLFLSRSKFGAFEDFLPFLLFEMFPRLAYSYLAFQAFPFFFLSENV